MDFIWSAPAALRILEFLSFTSLTGLVAQVQINKNFQRKIVNIFLPINFNTCFGCSKEPSH